MNSKPTTESGRGTWKQRVAALVPESNKAYLIALRVTGSPALAEEAVQEAYAELLQLPLKDEGHAQAVAYLLKTVRNRAIDLSRSSQNRKQREDEYAVRRDGTFRSPAELSEASEVARAASSALAELPIEEREAVSLCFEQNLSRQTVSTILDVPERTVSHRVQRGLEKLRLRLATQGFAALTPVVIGEGLRELGVPPAPSGLMRAVSDVANGAVHKSVTVSKYVAGKAAAKSGAGAGLKVVAGIVLVSAAVTAVMFANNSQPTSPVQRAAAPASLPVVAPVVNKPVSDGLVGYWKFDEGKGVVAKDSSGNGNDGTLVNSPAWSEGKSGSALKFDGIRTRVDVPNSASLDIAGHQITIALWANLIDKADGQKDHVMLGKAWSPGTFDVPYWQYAAEYSNRTKTFDLLFSDASAVFRGPYSFPAKLGGWKHVAFTYDGVNVKGYLDGVEKLSVPETRNIQARGYGLRIGIDEVFNQQCKGQLDEIRIYNRALSPAEIAALAETSKKP